MTLLQVDWYWLIAIGFLAGTIGSLFGVGGGIVTTPILNVMGLPMPLAVATSAVVIAGSSTSATIRNRKLRNVEWKLGLWLAAFMLPGVEVSARVMAYFQRLHPGVIDPWARVMFILAVLITTAVWLLKKDGREPTGGMWRRLQVAPFVRLESGRDISVWVVAGAGLGAGLFAGFFGLGGGRIIMPVLIGIVCLDLKRCVGTSSFIILLSAIFSATTYAIKGLTVWPVALLILVGALLGAWLGNAAMHALSTRVIRILYLCLSVAVLASMSLKQMGQSTAAAIVLLVVCSGIAVRAYVGNR